MRKLAREMSEQKMATGQSKLTEGLNKTGEKTCVRKVKKIWLRLTTYVPGHKPRL